MSGADRAIDIIKRQIFLKTDPLNLIVPDLTQEVADELIAVQKVFLDKDDLIVNRPVKERRELQSIANPDHKFYLHITQTAIEFGRFSTNTRFFSFPLVRVCVDKDARHPNPDDTIIVGSHIHFYKEGYMDKYAFPLTQFGFTSENIVPCVQRFLEVCNIEKIKILDQSLIGFKNART